MKKKAIVVVLVIALILSFTVSVFAEARFINPTLSLALNGSTATCKFKVTDPGKYINATMELWQGSTFITSWSTSGYSVVSMSETYTITSGLTYTLKGYGTSGGVSFTAPDVTRP
jgi:hypothetical protein